ncbi:MAG: glycosyltransferase [Planctomycetaceae bacterium]
MMPSRTAPSALQIIVLASTLDDDGGIPVCVARLAEGLHAIGVDVEVGGQYAGARMAPVVEELQAATGVPVFAVRRPWSVPGQIAAARAIGHFIGDRARTARIADRRVVVHAHGVWVAPVVAAVRAACAAGAGVVISPHGMLRHDALRKSPIRKRIALATAVREMVAAAGTIHATSPAEADELRATFPGCTPVIVPLGIESIAAPVRAAIGEEHVRTAGYLGRILPIKNLEMLLDGWAAARPRGWQLVVAGPGEPDYVATLESRTRALGIMAEVTFQPAVAHDRIAEFLSQLDLFVLPSRSEAFSLIVGEALACGTPAIVSTAAPWEGILEARCGWWVAPRLPDLTAAIQSATAHEPAELAAMGRRGRNWVRDEYDWKRIARRHLDELYAPSLGVSGRRGRPTLPESPSP